MTSWQEAFVAMSVALGTPLDEACEPLGEAGLLRAEPLLEAFRAPTRAARAQALASAVTAIAVDVERARLT
jgi:hypothetical protein